jgi:hypothetical protein
MKDDVFISHAEEDQVIAGAICGKLESAGLKCWAETRDYSGGEDRTEAARKAIGSCRLFVLVLSEEANAASHIEREIAHAFYMRRLILPFRLAEASPRREILFYLGNVPWCNAANPPTEEDLEALTARINRLVPGLGSAGHYTPAQSEKKKVVSASPSNSALGNLDPSQHRTTGILKWVAITTFLCAVVGFVWFAVHQTTEWASLAERHRRSVDRDFSVSPTPLPQARGDALESKQTPTVTSFGMWQSSDGTPAPFVQGPKEPPVHLPANATPLPQSKVTPGESGGGLASPAHPRQVPPVVHRVSREHHQEFPGTQVKEARRIADLENQRDSLRSQLKETEERLLAIQERADAVKSQRDELQTRLTASEEKAQIAQKSAAMLASELDQLHGQLKETENRALTAEKGEELVRAQRNALEIEMGEVRERAQRAEANANLVARQRDAMEAELKKKEDEETQDRNAQLNQHDTDQGELAESAPDTQFQEVRQHGRPAHENAEFAQTLPPNPGQNAKPAPLTETLNSSVQPAGPSRD